MQEIEINSLYSYSFWCPPIYVFAVLSQSKCNLILEKHENYQKRSWRNRTTLIGPQGIQHLSVPLRKGKNNKMLITSVRISNEENWKQDHLRGIQACYQSAPYFEHYFPLVEDIYQMEWSYLWNWNMRWIQFWIQTLGFQTNLLFTSDFGKPENTLHLLSKENKGKILNNRSDKFWYPQVFEDELGFRSDVSMLDALFCAGPETKTYFKTFFSSTFDSNKTLRDL